MERPFCNVALCNDVGLFESNEAFKKVENFPALVSLGN